jgi:hypothetical protein
VSEAERAREEEEADIIVHSRIDISPLRSHVYEERPR